MEEELKGEEREKKAIAVQRKCGEVKEVERRTIGGVGRREGEGEGEGGGGE